MEQLILEELQTQGHPLHPHISNRPFPCRAKDYLIIQDELQSQQLAAREKAIENTWLGLTDNPLTDREVQLLKGYYSSGEHWGNGDQPDHLQSAAEKVEEEFSNYGEGERV